MNQAPALEPRCNSWVIADAKTGKAVCETFERPTADAAARNANYVVQTASQWLGNLNRKIKEAKQ